LTDRCFAPGVNNDVAAIKNLILLVKPMVFDMIGALKPFSPSYLLKVASGI
jgi:hypothetical protein